MREIVDTMRNRPLQTLNNEVVGGDVRKKGEGEKYKKAKRKKKRGRNG